MTCECISETNKMLAGHNTQIMETIVFGDENNPGYTTVTLVTEKLVPRKSSVTMLPTFCPFCGVRYRPVEKETT